VNPAKGKRLITVPETQSTPKRLNIVINVTKNITPTTNQPTAEPLNIHSDGFASRAQSLECIWRAMLVDPGGLDIDWHTTGLEKALHNQKGECAYHCEYQTYLDSAQRPLSEAAEGRRHQTCTRGQKADPKNQTESSAKRLVKSGRYYKR
jgi:hypothetical protein